MRGWRWSIGPELSGSVLARQRRVPKGEWRPCTAAGQVAVRGMVQQASAQGVHDVHLAGRVAVSS